MPDEVVTCEHGRVEPHYYDEPDVTTSLRSNLPCPGVEKPCADRRSLMDYLGMKHIHIRLTRLEAKALSRMVSLTEFFEDVYEETAEDRKLIAAAYRAIKKLDTAREGS